nr:glutaredoxin [Cellulomonas sp. APG4]
MCHDAAEALARLASEHPLEILTLEADSPEGRALVAEHRPAMSPLVLLEGRYFSAGRLPRRKLTRALGRDAAAASARTA